MKYKIAICDDSDADQTAIPLPRGAYDGINRAIINMR
jgi:hypothetical protein